MNFSMLEEQRELLLEILRSIDEETAAGTAHQR